MSLKKKKKECVGKTKYYTFNATILCDRINSCSTLGGAPRRTVGFVREIVFFSSRARTGKISRSSRKTKTELEKKNDGRINGKYYRGVDYKYNSEDFRVRSREGLPSRVQSSRHFSKSARVVIYYPESKTSPGAIKTCARVTRNNNIIPLSVLLTLLCAAPRSDTVFVVRDTRSLASCARTTTTTITTTII